MDTHDTHKSLFHVTLCAKKKLHVRIWGRLGLLGLTRIGRNPKIDFRNSIIAIINFDSQFLQSEQSEQLGLQHWTLKVKFLQKPTSSNSSRSGVKSPLESSNPSPPSNLSRPRICKLKTWIPGEFLCVIVVSTKCSLSLCSSLVLQRKRCNACNWKKNAKMINMYVHHWQSNSFQINSKRA